MRASREYSEWAQQPLQKGQDEENKRKSLLFPIWQTQPTLGDSEYNTTGIA